MRLIDSHCHLDFVEFDIDRNEVITHAQQLGLSQIIVPGVMASSWSGLLKLLASHPMLHGALGLHPVFLDQHTPSDIELLAQALNDHPQIIAVGEIGLDFYLPELDKQLQIELFTTQVRLAEHFDLPLILHVRKAHDEVLKILRRSTVKGGIVHAFNGSLQQAEQYMRSGFLFGVGGALTYPRATKLQALFTQLPLEHIVLETDSPDMPLFQQNDQRNSPENIPLVCKKLAEIRQQPEPLIAETTTINCLSLLKII